MSKSQNISIENAFFRVFSARKVDFCIWKSKEKHSEVMSWVLNSIEVISLPSAQGSGGRQVGKSLLVY